MREFRTVIVGSGAAGIVAAINAKRKGGPCVICERLPRVGKKILASGNGRCNLSNKNLTPSNYNPASRSFVTSVFSRFGNDKIEEFFRGLGLELVSEEGRVFPATNQSASVLRVLELEMKRLDIPVELDFPVERIEHQPEGMVVVSSKANKKIKCSSVIIAGGGKSYPALGSDGSAYKVAAALGHNIVEPVPSAVPLVVKDKLCHLAQGQRFDANLKAVISGETVAESRGDILITKYGISGTAVLDISREISIAINRNRFGDVWVHADIVPFIAEDALVQNIEESVRAGRTGADVFAGVLPYKVAAVLSGQLAGAGAWKIASELKCVRFKVSGTRGWNEAEFTAGGVDTGQIDPLTMESKIRRGIYFAGEILDVDGRRGGYNLAWAWASGYIAGGSAAS